MEFHTIIGATEKKRAGKGARRCCTWAVKEGLREKVIFGQSSEGGKRISHGHNSRLRIPGKGQPNVKVLRWEHVCLRKRDMRNKAG